MRRYLALWAEFFRLSWRTERSLTIVTTAALTLPVGSVALGAVALSEVVDGITRQDSRAAVVWSVVAAVCYAVNLVLVDMAELLKTTTADRVARLSVHRDVHLGLALLPGLEHLERSEFLDRVTLVRANTGLLVQSAWNALGAASGVLQLFVTVLLLGAADPRLLVLLVLAVVPLLCNQRGERIVARAELETAESYRLHEHLIETTTSAGPAKEIRVAGSADELIRRQADAWTAAMAPRTRSLAKRAAYLTSGWAVFAAGLVGGLYLLVDRIAAGRGTVGDLVLAVAVASSLRQTISGAVSSTASSVGAARVIDPYLWLRDYAEKEQRAQPDGATSAPEALTQGLVVEDLSYTYPNATAPALDRVSFHIPPGTVVAVVGEYGSGKTTLVKLLSKMYEPTSGRITIDGTDLRRLDAETWRTRLSAVYQDFGRFHTVLAETIGLGQVASLDDRQKIAQAVREASAESIVAALPDGLDSQLGVEFGGAELSEGQWQRTALARASMRPDALLFILDEPTASLDAPSERDIFERYMRHARARASLNGAITVVVSHRFSTVTSADLILVLDSGRLLESGDHATLMERRGRYAELYSMQAEAFAGPEPIIEG